MVRIAPILVVLGVLSARAGADTLPSKQQALDTVTAWRTAILAVPCDRKTPNDPWVCSGAAVTATMPAPVSFGMIGDSNTICDQDSEKWEGKTGIHPIDAGTDYDTMTGCLRYMIESNHDGPITVVTISAANKFLSKPARKQLKPLAKTTKLVRLKLAPTEGDPNSHHDVVVAVTLATDGTPKVTAVFALIKEPVYDGE